MNFDTTFQPYGSNRFCNVAKNGVVATSQPLAAQAGLEILQKGGNAVDAAIATAAALTVVEPTSNGIGGDAFALVWMKDTLHGLNASGYAPELISVEKVLATTAENGKMPKFGWTPITVPGVPSAWASLSKKFGKLSLIEVLAPAIRYAKEGFPLSPIVAKYWKIASQKYKVISKDEKQFDEWFKTFTPNGVIPTMGDMVTLPNHAATLESIGNTYAESFYRGELADKIEKDSIHFGGYLRKSDLANYYPEWVKPISVSYHGYDIHEIPPNGQGIVALMGLNILKNFDFTTRDCADTYHKQFEAIKIAFADAKCYVTDPKEMKVTSQDLLSEEFGKKRAAEINEMAQEPKPYDLASSGTVYLCTADSEGNMVSYIQSNYMGFGSGVVVRDTGIALQNRGSDFSLDLSHDNVLKPLKKTYHTIIPGFITQGKEAIGPFGVMGGYMQPQGHIQVAMNLIDFKLNPQQALDAPRWQWMEGKKFIVEPDFNNAIALQLAAKGHMIDIALESGGFGRGQVIIKLKNGVYVSGCDKRCDSTIASY